MLPNRRAIVALAFATLFISSVEISHAQPVYTEPTELLVVQPGDSLKVSVPGDLEPNWPTLIEMSDRSLVMASHRCVPSHARSARASRVHDGRWGAHRARAYPLGCDPERDREGSLAAPRERCERRDAARWMGKNSSLP